MNMLFGCPILLLLVAEMFVDSALVNPHFVSNDELGKMPKFDAKLLHRNKRQAKAPDLDLVQSPDNGNNDPFANFYNQNRGLPSKEVLELFGSVFPKAVEVMNKIMLTLRNDIFQLYKTRFPSLNFQPSKFSYSNADKLVIKEALKGKDKDTILELPDSLKSGSSASVRIKRREKRNNENFFGPRGSESGPLTMRMQRDRLKALEHIGKAEAAVEDARRKEEVARKATEDAEQHKETARQEKEKAKEFNRKIGETKKILKDLESQGEEVGGVPHISRVEAERKQSELENHLPEISIQEMPVATKVKVDMPSSNLGKKNPSLTAYEKLLQDIKWPGFPYKKRRRKRSIYSPQDQRVMRKRYQMMMNSMRTKEKDKELKKKRSEKLPSPYKYMMGQASNTYKKNGLTYFRHIY